MSEKPVLVIGDGVSGKTTALKLAEKGRDVEVWTKEQWANTTSNTAAAFCEPFLVEPADRAANWCRVSMSEFGNIAQTNGTEAGVEARELFSIFQEYPQEPEWSKTVPNFRRLTHTQLQAAYEGTMPAKFKHGFGFTTWMVEMPKYLRHLDERFRKRGNVTARSIEHIEEAFDAYDLVVNCSALGSREIDGINDTSVYPIAGQVAQVKRTVEETILFDTITPTYIVPRGDNTIIGGTAHEHLYSRTPITETTADIKNRCSAFLPHLLDAEIEVEMVGLRPARPEVRLEHQLYGLGKHLFHNYGHGGGGVTISHGCATEIAALVEQYAPRH